MLIVICDDFQKDANLLYTYCRRYEHDYALHMEILIFSNAGELLQNKKARAADILLLDIYMEGTSGMDVAHILRSKGYTGAIIFTTRSQEHYAQGYEVEAIHYLVKPIQFSKFSEAMYRITRRKKKEGMLRITCGRDAISLPVNRIAYIEVLRRKTIIHTDKEQLIIRETLASLEERLKSEPFLRCYRSFLINMDFVLRLKEDGFLMRDRQIIPISRDNSHEIRNRYLEYIFKKEEVLQ